MHILTPLGYKEDSSLHIGDEVIGCNPKTGQYSTNKIEQIDTMKYKSMYFKRVVSWILWTIFRIVSPYDNHEKIIINNDKEFFQYQSIYSKNGLTHAYKLRVGGYIRDEFNQLISIKSIDRVRAKTWTRFIISNDHSYIADGILVHNASRFWISGTGNWNGTNTTNWSGTSGGASGASVPTAGDDVFFDASSGTGTITIITANPVCHSFDASASSVLTLVSSGTRAWTVGGQATLTTACVFKLGTNLTFTGGGTSLSITWDNRSGGLSVTTNGVTLNGVNTVQTGTNASTVGATFVDNFNIASAILELQRGTYLVSSGKTLTCGQVNVLGSGSKTINWTTATIAAEQWIIGGTPANCTLTGDTSSILNLTAPSQSMTGGGKSYPGLVHFQGGGSSSIGDSNTFYKLYFSGTTYTDVYTLAANQTVTNEFKCDGSSYTSRISVFSSSFGSTRTITVTGATVNGQIHVNFRDIAASGATLSGTDIGDCAGNSGITFTSPNTRYANVGGSNKNWTDNIWTDISGNSPGASYYPLPQDTAVFDNNTFSANGIIVTILDPAMPIIDTSALNNHTFTITSAGAPFYYGNIALCAQATWSSSSFALQTFAKRGTQTFTSNGAILAIAGTGLAMFNLGGTLQPLDDMTFTSTNSSQGMVIYHGTLNPLGNITISSITPNGSGTKGFTGTSGKTLTLTGVSGVLFNILISSTVTPNGMAVAITDTGASSKTFYASTTLAWGDIIVTAGGSGPVVVGAQAVFAPMTVTFKSLKIAGIGTKTIQFEVIASSSNIYQFQTQEWPRGSAGNIITISTNSPTVATNVVPLGGPLDADYISLKDSNASDYCYAGPHSTLVSNTTKWIPASVKVRGSMSPFVGV